MSLKSAHLYFEKGNKKQRKSVNRLHHTGLLN